MGEVICIFGKMIYDENEIALPFCRTESDTRKAQSDKAACSNSDSTESDSDEPINTNHADACEPVTA